MKHPVTSPAHFIIQLNSLYLLEEDSATSLVPVKDAATRAHRFPAYHVHLPQKNAQICCHILFLLPSTLGTEWSFCGVNQDHGQHVIVLGPEKRIG